MPISTGALENSLSSLYDYSSNFKVSIDLVQRLAHQLKLETFVDKLGYTVDAAHQTPGGGKTQRLTIAGTSILIDIDFVDDNDIVNVSLSLANHTSSSSSISEVKNPNSHIKSSTQDANGVTNLLIDPAKNPVSFFQQGTSGSASIAEEILLSNLRSKKLNSFPVNLKYLAGMDKLSSSSVDVFSFLERVALLLYTISSVQSTNDPRDWLLSEGYITSTGKIRINDDNKQQLGVFSDYWQDNRYINHENGDKTNLVGKNYNMLLKIVSSHRESKLDYFEENRTKVWDLHSPQGGYKPYRFDFDVTSNPDFLPGNNLSIELVLNHPVYLPVYLLEYLGLLDYKKKKTGTIVDEMFETLNTGDEIVNKVILESNSEISFKIAHNFTSNNVAPIKSVVINQLTDLAILIPNFRNFLVLANIYRSLCDVKSQSEILPGGIKSRRNSKVGNIASNSIEKELTEEAKKKLKESLKLPDDVTDEELLSLNAISENATFSTIQPINREAETDLDSFFKNTPEEPAISVEEQNAEKEEYFQLSLDDIDSASPYYDLQMSLQAQSRLGDIWVKFKIANGVIVAAQDDSAMEVDSDDIKTRFIRALNLTEDVIKSIKYAYM
ncbi:hypothetical protein G9P44_004054 [Scheffersomyces stipitis]|nr:hypothetical protein G9P44_004054 [Scheffersomyces stipitis]